MKITFGLVIAVAIGAMVLLVEASSIRPVYRKEMATIKSIQDDPPYGFIGEDKRTLVKFKDGSTLYLGGARGEIGEEILVSRQVGRESMLGWNNHMEY